MLTLGFLIATAIGFTAQTSAQIILDFRKGDQGFTAETESGEAKHLWAYGPQEVFEGSTSWFIDGIGVPSVQTLTSPRLAIEVEGVVTLTIEHRYSFDEKGSESAMSGGHLRLRVNGGEWTELDPKAYTQGGAAFPLEKGILALGEDGKSVAGWWKVSEGYGKPAYSISSASIGYLKKSDEVEIQFRAGWLEGQSSENVSWDIKSIEISVANPVPEPELSAVFAGFGLGMFAIAARARRNGRKPF